MSAFIRYKKGFSVINYFKSNWLWIVIPLGFLGMVAVSAALVATWDKSTFTPVCEKSPRRVFVLVGDFSDPNTLSQKDQLEILLERKLLRPLRAGDRIHISRLTDDSINPIKWMYKGCDPGSGKEANPLIETADRVDEHRGKIFISSLNKALEHLQTPEEQKKTPLIEGFKSLSNFLRLEYSIGNDKTPKVHIILFSDLLQNSQEVSVYRNEKNTEEKWRKLLKDHTALFENAEITIGFIRRPKHRQIQSQKHIKRFENFLHDSGVKRVQIIDIY